jgi:hypothetical protein
MLNLRKFFEILFNNPKISDDALRVFAEDHLQRLVANNDGGGYTTMIAATEQAVTDYFGSISSEDTATAIRGSLTKARDAVIASFQKAVRRREGRIRDTFGEDSPQYLEFFPQGLTEYAHATLGTTATLIDRLVNATTKYSAQLGQPMVDEFTALKTNYASAQREQAKKKGEVTSQKTTTSTNRDEVELQLMDNLLTLAKEFKGNPDRGMDFFDQSIIRPDSPSPEPDTAPAPTPKP